MASPKATIWKPARTFLGRAFGFTKYETYEQITPDTRFGKLDGFEPEIADAVQKRLLGMVSANGTPPPRPEAHETVDRWMMRLQTWLFNHGVTPVEAGHLLEDAE